MKDDRVNPETSVTAFGRYLKSMRMQLGIPLEAVADEIRISHRQLKLIEAEEHEQLPDVVYVKGILRAYAGYIGVDADDIVDRYLINWSDYQRKSSGKTLFGYGVKKIARSGLWAVFLIIFIVISVYMIYGFHAPPDIAGNAQKTNPSGKNPAAGKEAASGALFTENQGGYPVNPEGKLLLEIDAVEDADVEIIIDDSDPLKYTLHPMDHMEMEASETINLLVSNAAGVNILLNKKPVKIDGSSGDLVRIELPHPEKTE